MGMLTGLVSRLKPGVTVVVPAHNVERYLGPCLDSVLAQTWWDRCRILVVDDGSTDRTGRVADEYAATRPRIQVLHQPNAGPGAGAARNRGLDLVTTQQVLFLDGDDELAPRAVELLSGGLRRHGLPLAVGATEQFPEPRSWLWSGYFEAGVTQAVSIEQVPQLVHDARTCDKLYDTAWLRRSGLRFAEGIHHQDTVVNVPAMLRTSGLVLVGDVVYRYRKRAEGTSVMDSHFTRLDNYWDHLQVIETLNGMASQLTPSRRPLLDAFLVRSFQGFARRAPGLLPAERLPEFFVRAKAVIGGIDPAIIEQATTGADQRAAYVAMREDDLASFLRLDALAGRLRAHRGDLYLDLPCSTETNRQLLQTGATRAWADELRLIGNRLRFRLRLRIGGASHLDTALASIEARFVQGGEPVAVAPVTVRPHVDDPRQHTGVVSVPLDGLPDGSYRVRLGFLTGTGATARWLRRPPDAATEAAGDSTVGVQLAIRDNCAEFTVERRAPFTR
ncbi:MAG: glycosyltransferase [Micropruina sp.]|uniref:glycosyltransferase n=1 Tax=Micropruina sp. TaxID=2737536 RepID=UPI0039E6F153